MTQCITNLDWMLKNTANHVQFRQTHGSNTSSSKSNVEVKFNYLLSKYQTYFCYVKMLEFNCLKQIFFSKLFIYVQIVVFVSSSNIKQITSVLRTRIGEIYLVFKASSHTFPVLFLGHASDLITTSRSQIEQIIVSTLTLLCSHQIIQFAATK